MKLDFDWRTFAWVRKGNRRSEVLKYLSKAEKPRTATDVKKAQHIDITQAAFTLKELREKNLIDCLNPEDHQGKLFIITSKGKEILEELE